MDHDDEQNHLGTNDSGRTPDQRPALAGSRKPLIGVAIAASLVIGLGLILVAATLGRCDAFGGSCPADRPSLFDDDVFGMAAFGAALIVVVPVFVHRPSWRRLGVAIVAGIAAGLIVGLLIRSSAYG
jgi:hypothetical protein